MPSLVPDEILEGRFAQHYAFAQIFIEEWHEFGCGPPVVVNGNSLFLTIKSAYDDIYRYKLYHHGEGSPKRSNGVKRAAYLCKWICRFKPIEYADPSKLDRQDTSGLLVNAYFAQWLARTHIAADSDKRFFQFSNQYLFELLYDLTYRELSGDALLHIFQNAYTCVVDQAVLYEPIG